MERDELTAYLLYSLLYCFFAICVIAPPAELVSAGLSIQNVFSNFLGSQDLHFIRYHQRRTAITLVIHSLLPLGYYVEVNCLIEGRSLFDFEDTSSGWSMYLTLAISFPIVALTLFYYWSLNDWDQHPIAKQLQLLTENGSSWRDVASSINMEFRRPDKFASGCMARRVIVTDSWVIKTSTYHVYVAHQNDIQLSVASSDEHEMSYDSMSTVQYLNINIIPYNAAIKCFTIRLNSLEYGELRGKLRTPLLNARNFIIRQSLSDQFLVAFQNEVEKNPVYILSPETDVETCVGCLQKESNIKLQKLCSELSEGDCEQCYCRPMWCIDCMGKWFASQQDKDSSQTWLSGKTPCPTCRRRFCILDVCYIHQP
ncbi:E3 ubiquitin-protein ligase TM129-like [Argonauta hians]